MSTKRKRQQWKMVFEGIMSVYIDFKSVSGTLSCASLYKSIARQGAGKGSFNSSVVQPYPSDFICEIEIIARKALNENELNFFNHSFKNGFTDNKDRSIKLSITQKMGEALIAAKIHPIELYFKPRDTR